MEKKEECRARLYFYEKLKDKAEKILNRYKKIYPSRNVIPSTAPDELKLLKEELESILEIYNRERNNTEKLLGISIPLICRSREVYTLNKIVLECEKIIGFLKSKVSPLPQEQEIKLESLRKELLSLQLLDEAYERNIEEAIKECEEGHFLASAMISSRIIQCILDKIKGKNIEEKNKFLKEIGIIEKDNKGEITTEFIQKAAKKSRNYFTHNINAFASCSDAIELLGICIKLLKVMSLINEKEKEKLKK